MRGWRRFGASFAAAVVVAAGVLTFTRAVSVGGWWWLAVGVMAAAGLLAPAFSSRHMRSRQLQFHMSGQGELPLSGSGELTAGELAELQRQLGRVESRTLGMGVDPDSDATEPPPAGETTDADHPDADLDGDGVADVGDLTEVLTDDDLDDEFDACEFTDRPTGGSAPPSPAYRVATGPPAGGPPPGLTQTRKGRRTVVPVPRRPQPGDPWVMATHALQGAVRTGTAAVGGPRQMPRDDTATVVVRISPDQAAGDGLLVELAGHEQAVAAPLPVTPVMRVSCVAPGFAVTALSEADQQAGAPGSWTWTFEVCAQEAGERKLLILIAMRAPGPDGAWVSHPALTHPVVVTVTRAALVGGFFGRNWVPLTGWGLGLAGTIAAWLKLF